MKVLVCEDDPIIQKIIEVKLTREGHEVSICSHGKDAVDFLEKNSVNLIITDLLMPYFSGLELINHIRNELKITTPIIVVSKLNMEDDVLKAFELGADDYVVKPFSPNELSIRARRFLR